MTDSQILNIKLIKAGHVLQTHHGIRSFKFLGNLYTTNHRRIKRGRGAYSFDDPSWRLTHKCIFYKIKAIITGQAFKF